ncbi:MAG: HEPN domain-containing protein [Armatimonadetes bacterium]|nr:HEPN domain-containing protein [Armatimonadota bacterium]
MTEEQRAVARWRIENARRTLEDGGFLATRGSFRSSLNRSYYAAFYAARALLATRSLDSAKHSGVIALLDREFVKPGTIEREHGKALHDLFDSRQEGDYADMQEVSRGEAERALLLAGALVH